MEPIRALSILCAVSISFLTGQDPLPEPQSPSSERIRALLAAAEPKDRAWGAWYAATSASGGFASDLVACLDRSLAEPGAGQRPLLHALMDACILCEATLSPTTLHAVAIQQPAATVVLAARDPAAHSEALRSLWTERADEPTWIASGSLLIEGRTSGVVAALFTDLTLQLNIWVIDTREIGAGSGRTSTGRMGGRITVPEGFPPIAVWTLGTAPSPGARAVSQRATPVYARRRVHHTRTIGIGGGRNSTQRNRTRLAWINGLLADAKEDLRLMPSATETVRWTDADAYVAAVRRHREALSDRCRDAATRLTREGWISVTELQALKPRIEVKIHDLRQERDTPLPPLR